MMAKIKSIPWNRILLYLVLVLSAAFFLLPIYMLLNTSFKSYLEVSLSNMWQLPQNFSLDSFSKAWLGSQIRRISWAKWKFLKQHLADNPCRFVIGFCWLDQWLCLFKVEISRFRCADLQCCCLECSFLIKAS